MSEKEKIIYDCTYCNICKGHYDHPEGKPYLVSAFYDPDYNAEYGKPKYPHFTDYLKYFVNEDISILDILKGDELQKKIHKYRKQWVEGGYEGFEEYAIWVSEDYFSYYTNDDKYQYLKEHLEMYEKDSDDIFTECYGNPNQYPSMKYGINISGMILPQGILLRLCSQGIKKDKYSGVINASFSIIINTGCFRLSMGRRVEEFTNFLDISSSLFIGDLCLSNKEFIEAIIAKHSIFYGVVFFNNFIFKKMIQFSDSIFKESVSFSCSTFNKIVNFKSTYFFGLADFSETKFKDFVYFNDIQLHLLSYDTPIFKEFETYFNPENKFIPADIYMKQILEDIIYYEESTLFYYNDYNDYSDQINQYNKILGEYKENIYYKDQNNIDSIGALTFRDAIFERNVNFSKSTFEGGLYFYNVNFKDKVMFKNSRYTDLNLNSSIFADDVSFDNSTIKGDLDFRHSTFKKGSSFNETQIIGVNLNFTATTFKNYVLFQNIQYKNLILDKCYFEQGFYLSSDATKNTELHQEPKILSLNYLVLNADNNIIENIQNTKISLLGTIIPKIYFNGVDFNYQALEKSNWFKRICIYILSLFTLPKHTKMQNEIEGKQTLLYIESQYRSIKNSFLNSGAPQEAGKWYIAEMNLKVERLFKEKFWVSKMKGFGFWVYGAVTSYGESIIKPACWLAAIVIWGFGWFNCITNSNSPIGDLYNNLSFDKLKVNSLKDILYILTFYLFVFLFFNAIRRQLKRNT